MGQLRNKRIVQSRIWLDPNVDIIPSYDYDYSYPVTVYAAVMKDMDDDSSSLADELDSIYRLINGKQDRIGAGLAGQLMTWSGVEGQIGALDVTKSIHPEPSKRSHHRIPTEQAVGEALDAKTSNSDFIAHTDDGAIHITDIERNRWNGAAPISSLNAHITNSTVHVTSKEKAEWNSKASQSDLDAHIININNPHRVTAHQVGAYSRKEVDDLFENLRESFFNHINISWDDRNNIAKLVEYHPANWNPNYVLEYGEDLPDVPDPSLTYFALKPATDYESEESQDVVIYIKQPGLSWQEVGFQTMNMGDMVIRYPDTSMFVWVQGHFRMFGGVTVDPDIGGESDLIWRPALNEEGLLTWSKSRTTEPPLPMDIKGKDGVTPVKGVDYVDGKDGEGVPVGGTAGMILTKITDENFDTQWKSVQELLSDMVIGGGSLPEGSVTWESIKGRPVIYSELGPNEDGVVTQKAITAQLDNFKNTLNEMGDAITGPNGVNALQNSLAAHLNDYNNPHRVTPAMIGAVPISTYTMHVQNFDNPHNVTAAQIGLGKVDNTRDMDKPISTAVQYALDNIVDQIKGISGAITGANYITDAVWHGETTTIAFAFRDGSSKTITIPIADVFNSVTFDPAEGDLVITLPSGEEHRVNISGLIKPYTGGISPNIQVKVENDNIINANVLPGTIGELEIAPSVHLRGSPVTTTQPVSDNSTRIATTEFVRSQVIDNLISYEPDRPLSANMGRILNQRKVDVEDIIEILNDIEGVDVIDDLKSTNPMAALSANMGRVLDLEKAPRVHTSTSGSTFGRATISLFGHARASDVDPLMDGTVSRGTDDGTYARGDHRHPVDESRAPIHWPDVAHNQYSFTGEPRSTLPPDDSNDSRIATTEWIRRNMAGCAEGICSTDGNDAVKIATLRSSIMDNPVFMRQIGSAVAITFTQTDTATEVRQLNVHGSGPAPIMYAGKEIIKGMIKADHTYFFVFNGVSWLILNPSANFALPDGDNSDEFITASWTRRNIVGTYAGESTTDGNDPAKTATLRSTYMDPVVFLRQIGSTVAITFTNSDASGSTPTTLNVNGTGESPILFGGRNLENGMIAAGHTHLFVFDGSSWRLVNPAPGTGFGSVKYTQDKISGSNPRLSGHMGFTVEGFGGSAATNGYVERAIFTIRFPYHSTDVVFEISNGSDEWAAQMGDGSTIVLCDPVILSTGHDFAVVQFSFYHSSYPSNSPCMLMYGNSNASYTITPKSN